jgi:hypothetical protein
MSARFFFPVGLWLLFACGAAAAATIETTSVLERGLHSQVVQTVSPAVDDQGNAVSVTNTFTQLQTGLNRWSEADGGWVPAVDRIERVNGMLVARQTQHQVIFGDGADATDGTIDLLMINGARFRIRPAGIAYTEFKDGQPGKSVFVAELQNSSAELTASTEVTYVAALGIADLRYDLSLAGLEQNVVFRQRPPRAQDLQMDPALVRIECWNQVLEAPAPAASLSTVTREDGSVDQDTQLDLCPMQINIGRAYAVDGAPDTPTVRVVKQYQTIGDSTWLIESVPYTELAPLLNKLPAQQASRSFERDKLRKLWASQSAGKRGLPLSLPEVRSAKAPARTDTRVASVRPEQDLSTPGRTWFLKETRPTMCLDS